MSFKKIEEKGNLRPEGRSCLLVHGYGRTATARIEALAAELGIPETLSVPESQLGCRMQEVLDGTASSAPVPDTVPDPFIVLSALTDQELHQFIGRFKETQLERPLFAVATPTNIGWKLGDLGRELGRERDEMAKRTPRPK